MPPARAALAATTAVLLVGTATTGLWWYLRAGRGTAPVPSVHSLAVLPLANLSRDPEEEYFADGMTDALILSLATAGSFDVISRTSVMRYKGTTRSVGAIAGELGVDAIVEGTVLRSGPRVRINARLIHSSERPLWSSSYEGELRDVLRLQAGLAGAVAREIEASVRPGSAAVKPSRRQVDPDAHEAYLRGRHSIEMRTRDALERATAFFESAIARDPGYAEPYVGLADCYNLVANYGFAPSLGARERAREAALAALHLDESLAEAHAALAFVKVEGDWDFAGAEREFRRSLTLNPSYAAAHNWYASFLLSQNRNEEALEEIHRARQLDPLSPIINANLGWVLLVGGRDEEALEQLEQSVGFDPHFAVTHYYLGLLRERRGELDAAVASLTRASELSGSSDYALAALAHALARAGQRGQALALRDRMRVAAGAGYVSPVSLAVADLGLGDRDSALAWLEQAFAERKGWLLQLKQDPRLDEVRSDPRYLSLVQRVGLP